MNTTNHIEALINARNRVTTATVAEHAYLNDSIKVICKAISAGIPIAEIASTLHTSRNAIYKRLNRLDPTERTQLSAEGANSDPTDLRAELHTLGEQRLAISTELTDSIRKRAQAVRAAHANGTSQAAISTHAGLTAGRISQILH